jgi:hypothetical protein
MSMAVPERGGRAVHGFAGLVIGVGLSLLAICSVFL